MKMIEGINITKWINDKILQSIIENILTFIEFNL